MRSRLDRPQHLERLPGGPQGLALAGPSIADRLLELSQGGGFERVDHGLADERMAPRIFALAPARVKEPASVHDSVERPAHKATIATRHAGY